MIKYEELKKEATEILDECGLEWQDVFLNPEDYCPDSFMEFDDEARWFNIILGKMIMMKELKEEDLLLTKLKEEETSYGKGWICRRSETGRGLRVHQTTLEGSVDTPKQAIINYLRLLK